MRIAGFNSNKTQIGVMSAWGLVLFSVLALKVFGFTIEEISPVLFSVSAIICTHLIGYALTDASASFGKAEKK